MSNGRNFEAKPSTKSLFAYAGPMRTPVGVIIEFPEMYKSIDRPRVGLEIPDELFVLPALLERREADLLIELYRLGHLADMQCVGSQFL
jgi:hypothetical protein